MNKSPRSLDSIVAFQIKKWEVGSGLIGADKEPVHWPVITISREYGALGAALGKLIAEQLGWEFWHNELVHAIAEDEGVADRIVETLDEHRRNSLAEMLGNFLTGRQVSSNAYLKRLLRTLHAISSHGKAVIVGRGAHYTVASDNALRVRVVAPLTHRAAGLVARRGLSEDEALKLISATDKDRGVFIRQAYDRDVATPSDYDLTINLSTVTLEAAVDLVLSAYRAKFGLSAKSA